MNTKQCPDCSKFMSKSPDGDTFWCKTHGNFDVADLFVMKYEKSHYVWFDENDRPFITNIKTNLKLSEANI